jgi:hypothetical protein
LSPAPTDKSTNGARASCSLWGSTIKDGPNEIMLSGGHPCNRKIGAMSRVIRGCALLLMAFTAWTEPALARSYLNCLAKKVVIVDAPRGSTSSSVEEHFRFWIDEAAKTLVLVDGTPLTVHRFDDHWISAARGDTSYELDRQNGNWRTQARPRRTVLRRS